MPSQIDILFEDSDLIVVNKPAGVPTIPGRQGGSSVRDLLARQSGGSAPLVVHRLDRGTSGVLIFAKTAEAHRSLCDQMRTRKVVKQYLALVRGYAEADKGMVDAALAPHPRTAGKVVVATGRQEGKPSQTRWEVVERFSGISFLRCFPLTGRQHQIRVHLAHIGLPLLVDELYSGTAAFNLSEVKPRYRTSGNHEERPLIARLTLHAEALEFAHPTTGAPLRVEAPLPKDFRATVTQLRKWGGYPITPA